MSENILAGQALSLNVRIFLFDFFWNILYNYKPYNILYPSGMIRNDTSTEFLTCII